MVKKSVRIIYEDGKEIESWSEVDNAVLDKVTETNLTKAERIVLNRIKRDTIAWNIAKD